MADIGMADANGNDHARLYLDAVQAQLGERVTNLGRRQTDLETEMRTGFRQIEQSIAGLSTTLSERSRPQWQALGVALTFAALLGGLAYMPIREATTDLKAAMIETNKSIQSLADRTVSRQEMDWRAARGAEDRLRSETAIADLRISTVTRLEWQERNNARNQEIEAIRQAMHREEENLQRQVDQLRADFGSVYGTRDVIVDLKKEIDNLRFRLNQGGRMPQP